MSKKIGNRTYFYDNPPTIEETYSVVGQIERDGTFGEYFHKVLDDDLCECRSYEKAESKMQEIVIKHLVEDNGYTDDDIDLLIAGDLLNQIVASSFSARNREIPFMGVYSACSTFSEAMILGGSLIEGKLLSRVICSTSSHFSSAERQYRFPLELGCQRIPTSQWTVTGAGGLILSNGVGNIKLTGFTLGKVIDKGVADVANMGAAMAPAVADTVLAHLTDTGRSADYYDQIITGDLGKFGSKIFMHLMEEKGVKIPVEKYFDCGAKLYGDNPKVNQGGSGAGCCASVFCSYVYHSMLENKFNKILFAPTGALLSKDSSLQGESIPGISHLVIIEKD